MLRSGSCRVLGNAREGWREGHLCGPRHRMRFLFTPLQTWCECSEHFSSSDGVQGIWWAVSHLPMLLMGNLTASELEMDKGWFLRFTFPCTAGPGSLAAMAALCHPVVFLWRAEPQGGGGRMMHWKVEENAECWGALLYPNPAPGPPLSYNSSHGQNEGS